MKKPRKHHHLSKFYVENFSEDGKLFVLSKEQNKIFSSNPTDVFAIKDFYFLKNFEDPLAVENSLAQLEDKAAPIVREICANGGKNINPEEGDILLDWISWLSSSRPKSRDFIDKILGQIEVLGRPILKDKGVNEENSQSIKEVKGNKGNKSSHIRTTLELHDKMLKFFECLLWSTIMLEDNIELITSDNPFCRFPEFPLGKVPFQYEPFLHALILFPLAKNCLLIGAARELNFDFNELASKDYIQHINSKIFDSSQKYVVASKKEQLEVFLITE